MGPINRVLFELDLGDSVDIFNCAPVVDKKTHLPKINEFIYMSFYMKMKPSTKLFGIRGSDVSGLIHTPPITTNSDFLQNVSSHLAAKEIALERQRIFN